MERAKAPGPFGWGTALSRSHRARLILPLIQVPLAMALSIHNILRPFSSEDPNYLKPDRQFCQALNAPAAAVEFLLMHVSDALFPWEIVYILLDTAIYFVLVGLLWYAVGIELSGGGRSVLSQKSGRRKLMDRAGVCFGVALFPIAMLVHGPLSSHKLYANLVTLPYLVWAVVITWFYWRDLRHASKENGLPGPRR